MDVDNLFYVHPQHFNPELFSLLTEEWQTKMSKAQYAESRKQLAICSGEWFPAPEVLEDSTSWTGRKEQNLFTLDGHFPFESNHSGCSITSSLIDAATKSQFLMAVDTMFLTKPKKQEAARNLYANLNMGPTNRSHVPKFDSSYSSCCKFTLDKRTNKKCPSFWLSWPKRSRKNVPTIELSDDDRELPLKESPVDGLTLLEFARCIDWATRIYFKNIHLFSSLSSSPLTTDDHFSSFTDPDKLCKRLADNVAVQELIKRRDSIAVVCEQLAGVSNLSQLVSQYLPFTCPRPTFLSQ